MIFSDWHFSVFKPE